MPGPEPEPSEPYNFSTVRTETGIVVFPYVPVPALIQVPTLVPCIKKVSNMGLID
jgi:hypothetical protein